MQQPVTEIKQICICGGGSLGLVCAGVFLSKGIKVNILSGHPDRWRRDIEVVDPAGKIYGGRLDKISSRPSEVIPSADMVFLTVPGFLIGRILKDIKPYLGPRSIVGSVVSSTGFFFEAHEILGSEHTLFGFQRVPYIARVCNYGSSGNLLGYKTSLKVAVENHPDPQSLADELTRLFDTPVSLLGNFYEASLTNSNPILHTGRLYAMWKDYSGEVFSCVPMFYADWTDESSEYLIGMDEEFQALLRSLHIKDGAIPSLLEYYESVGAQSLTAKMRSIAAFKSIQAPMKEVGGGYVPDFTSRYFTEDFPYGLKLIRDLAIKNNVATPVIDQVFVWGMAKLGNL